VFVTCFYALLQPPSGQLQFANAGHELPYCCRDAQVSEVRATGLPLGLMPGFAYDEFELALVPGDTLLFHSDGLVEAHNPQREMFGLPRLVALLRANPNPATIIDVLLVELERFTTGAGEQEDDLTLLTVQRTPDAARL
jgi:serine phosphatase RsbU (regulator of sigma subunit)